MHFILSSSEHSSSHPPLTCLCKMLQNRQSKWPYKGNTARISKAKSLPNHLTTKLLHFLTSYYTCHRNGGREFPYLLLSAKILKSTDQPPEVLWKWDSGLVLQNSNKSKLYLDFTILHLAIHIVWRVNVIYICRKTDIARKTTVTYPKLR